MPPPSFSKFILARLVTSDDLRPQGFNCRSDGLRLFFCPAFACCNTLSVNGVRYVAHVPWFGDGINFQNKWSRLFTESKFCADERESKLFAEFAARRPRCPIAGTLGRKLFNPGFRAGWMKIRRVPHFEDDVCAVLNDAATTGMRGAFYAVAKHQHCRTIFPVRDVQNRRNGAGRLTGILLTNTLSQRVERIKNYNVVVVVGELRPKLGSC